MEEWLVADWFGEESQQDGSRLQFLLSLGRDGRYADTVRAPDGAEIVSQGSWAYEPADAIIRFRPDTDRKPRGADAWRIWDRGPRGKTTTWILTECWPRGDKPLDRLALRAHPFGSGIPAPPEPRLLRWHDPALGELLWQEHGRRWTTTLSLGGRDVPLELKPDSDLSPGSHGATPEQQRAVIETWRNLPEGLPAVEPILRRQAAREVAQAVADYGAENELPQEEFADGLKLAVIVLWHDLGELDYRSAFFSDATPIRVIFNLDLSFREVEVG